MIFAAWFRVRPLDHAPLPARKRGTPARASRVLYPVTDVRNRGVHLMTEDAAVAGRRVGRYAALCGAEVLAASLTTPEAGYCRSCIRGVDR